MNCFRRHIGFLTNFFSFFERNIWRHVNVIGLFVLPFMVAACVETSGLAFQPTPKETTILKVGKARITIGGTSDYCIGNRTSQAAGFRSSAILTPCSPGHLVNDLDPPPRGLLLVTVSPNEKESASAERFDFGSFFKTAEGRAALSNDGDPQNVKILGTLKDAGVFYVHTRHLSGPIIPDTDTDRWRGFLILSGHIVSISLLSFVDRPVPDGLIYAQLESFADRLRILNTK